MRRPLVQAGWLTVGGGLVVFGLAFLTSAAAHEGRIIVDFTYPGCAPNGVCRQGATAVTFVAMQLVTNPILGEVLRRSSDLLPAAQVLQRTRVSCGVQPAARWDYVRGEWARLQLAVTRSVDWASLARQLGVRRPTPLLPNVEPCWPGAYQGFRLQISIRDADPLVTQQLSAAWAHAISAAIVTNPQVARVVTQAHLSLPALHDLRLERALGLGLAGGGLGGLARLLVEGYRGLKRRAGGRR